MNNLLAVLFVTCASKVIVEALVTELNSPRIPDGKYYIQEGEDVIFECTHIVSGQPPVSTLVFEFNKKELQYNEHVVPSHGVTELKKMFLKVRINKAQFSDAGVYTCKEDINSDNIFEMRLYVYRVNRPESVQVSENITSAGLRCGVENSPTNPNYGNERPERVVWFKRDEMDKFMKVEDEEGRVTINDLNDTLSIQNIDNTRYDDVGEYLCQVQPDAGARAINYSLTIDATAGVLPFKAESTKGIQGDPKQISCIVYGYPKPTVEWTVAGEEEEDDVGQKFNFGDRKTADVGVSGVQNSSILFSPLEEEDRGTYTCHVSNSYGSGEASIVLRVKDRYAALWPFLGICAEVAILCAVIFFFEKRRARKMREEEEDPAAGDGLINHREEELRQRKVQA